MKLKLNIKKMKLESSDVCFSVSDKEIEIEIDLDDLMKAIITSDSEPTAYDLLDELDRQDCLDLEQHIHEWMEDQELLEKE